MSIQLASLGWHVHVFLLLLEGIVILKNSSRLERLQHQILISLEWIPVNWRCASEISKVLALLTQIG